MLKTFIIDSESGGAGKDVVARTLADLYLYGWSEDYLPMPAPNVVVFDDERGRISGPGGYQLGGRLIGVHTACLESAAGWSRFGDILEGYIHLAKDEEIRVIFPLPSQASHRAFGDHLALASDILAASNALPLWVLTTASASVEALRSRIRDMPSIFAQGLAVKNLIFGHPDQFINWDRSAERASLVEMGEWGEMEFPELCGDLKQFLPRYKSLDVIERYGQLSLGHRMVFSCWRRAAWEGLALLEILGNCRSLLVHRRLPLCALPKRRSGYGTAAQDSRIHEPVP